MKRYIPIGLIVLSYLSLTGCASHRYPGMNSDLTQETWMSSVDRDPNKWTQGADRWFLTGDPNTTELASRKATYNSAMSTLEVRVPDFTNIKVNGDFQVQIFGTTGHNSVYVYGPNDNVRDVDIEVKGNILCVSQSKKARPSMRKVIVRIGVHGLNNLTHLGGGTVEGIRIQSNDMTVDALGHGNMYLAGNMNLKHLFSKGTGSVNVFGANAPELDIKSIGSGTVNVSGNVGIRNVLHHGRGDINVIGANSDNLKIYADGRGKVGINGIVNLREVKARDFTQVYVYNVTSTTLYAYAYDKASIGLAGKAQDVYIDSFKGACVGAKNLCATNAFVRSHASSHINIAGGNKVFAAATENSSIYLFGSPNMMSQFISGNGTVIPIWSEGMKSCVATPRAIVYKAERMSYKGEHHSYKGEEVNYTYSKWHHKPHHVK